MRRLVAIAATLVFASAGGEREAPAQGPSQPSSSSSSSSSPSTPRRLAFGEAVELAVREAPGVRAGAQGVVATEARVDAVRSQRYARLRTEGNLFVWDKALSFPFTDPMTNMTVPLVVRERVTSQLTVTLSQPISGLLVLHRLVALEQHGADAARADRDRARLDAGQRAAEAYLRVLSAKAQQSIGERSVDQVEAQLARAQVLEKGGVLGRGSPAVHGARRYQCAVIRNRKSSHG